MLNIRGVKVYTQDELMESLVLSIRQNIPDTLLDQHIMSITAEIGDMIGESEHFVQGYLKKALRLER